MVSSPKSLDSAGRLRREEGLFSNPLGQCGHGLRADQPIMELVEQPRAELGGTSGRSNTASLTVRSRFLFGRTRRTCSPHDLRHGLAYRRGNARWWWQRVVHGSRIRYPRGSVKRDVPHPERLSLCYSI